MQSLDNGLRELRLSEASCSKNRECRRPFPGAGEFELKDDQDFLVLGIEDNSFGGSSLTVILRKDPHIYRVWVYAVETGTFVIRGIQQQTLSKDASAKLLKYSGDPAYAKYWRKYESVVP